MRFIVFSLIFIALSYIAATVILWLKKKSVLRRTESLSVDVTNVCKGIAICGIMLSHIGNLFGVRFLTPLGSWGVGIFLILSGYGLEQSAQKKGLQDFWKKRMLTAWLPYAIAEIIGIIFLITPDYAEATAVDVLLDLLLIQPLHPFGWYMQCLFLCYIGFYLAHRLFKDNKVKKYIILSALMLVLFVFFRSLYKQQMFTFVCGILLSDSKQIKGKIMDKPLVGALLFGAGVICLIVRQVPIVRTLTWGYELIFAVQALMLALGTVSIINWVCRKIKRLFVEIPLLLGLISYELYLYHGWVYSWISTKPILYEMIALFFVKSVIVAVVAYAVRTRLMQRIKK